MTDLELNPDKDGETHINIYSKGKTELGKLLTNLANTPFDYDGQHFGSVEALWYWLLSDKKRMDFIPLNGFEAKKMSKTLSQEERVEIDDAFRSEICEGFRCKLRCNKNIVKMLFESELPFTHYYYYGKDGNYKIMDLPQHKWQCDEYEKLRSIIKEFYKSKISNKPKI